MRCPRDCAELKPVEQDEVEVQVCPKCKGEWLSADELGELVQHHSRVFTDEETEAMDALNKEIFTKEILDTDELNCPECDGIRMEHFNYADTSGIILHRCEQCEGLWADAGELDKIEALVDGWKGKLGQDEVTYGGILKKVEMEEEQMLGKQVSISRFGFVNSILRRFFEE